MSDAMTKPADAHAISQSDLAALLLQQRVERFLFDEAALLDARKFQEWLKLLEPDLDYWMPIRRIKTARELDQQFTARGDMALLDDDFVMISKRVKKLDSGFNWSEEPPSRTRYLITNIRVMKHEGGEIEVHSNFHLHRAHHEADFDDFIGRREDLLRETSDGLRLARRHIFLEQTVIQAGNMAVLF